MGFKLVAYRLQADVCDVAPPERSLVIHTVS